jgi:RHS repeat-associated protein
MNGMWASSRPKGWPGMVSKSAAGRSSSGSWRRSPPGSSSRNTRGRDAALLSGALAFSYCPGGATAPCNQNNGNLTQQVINPLGATQTYQYTDGMNRLNGVTENSTTAGQWSRNYTYDPYGNGWLSAYSTTSPAPSVSALTPTSDTFNINPSNGPVNRLVGSNYGYDLNGNQNFVSPFALTYDAENRQTTATSQLNGSATYAYDGAGQRVMKAVNAGSPTVFVYDAGGDLAAEYGSESMPCGTCYVTVDHLGSTRLVTGTSGILSRHDYLPFGEELFTSTRTAALDYGAVDDINQKFTGKERDAETGLDYFESRYFSSAQGRFTSPDEFKGGFLDAFSGLAAFQPGPLPYADISDPQTLNKYAYVRNNPLRYDDPNGHCFWDACVAEGYGVYVAGAAAVSAAAYLSTPQGQEATRSFIQGIGTLITTGVNAISSLIPGTSTQSQPLAGTPGTPAGTVVNAGTPASTSQQGTVSTGAMPLIVVSPGGDAIPVPNGASGPAPVVNPQGNTTGFGYTGGSGGYGMDPRVTDVRVMDPTPARGSSPGYPNGDVTYQNQNGQGVNPQTGRTVSNSDPSRHIPLSPPKTCAGGGTCP